MPDEQQPLNPVGDGRGPKGRFATGNKAGRGNPLNRRAQQIRNDLLRESTRADRKAIARKLIDMAKAGDIAAIREYYDRTCGKAERTELRERIERLEGVMQQSTNTRVNYG